MDSTTITLFSNILKGAGRNPKLGKKKGKIKARTVISSDENIPQLVRFTSSATYDHVLLKYLNLPKGLLLHLIRRITYWDDNKGKCIIYLCYHPNIQLVLS